MRFLLFILLTTLTALTAEAQLNIKPIQNRRQSVAAACTTVHEQNSSSASATISVGFNTTDQKSGQIGWDPAAAITVCKLDAVLTAVGTITTNNYTAEIWTYANPDLGSLVQASDTIAGQAWSSSTVSFVFAGAALSSGTQYCVLIKTSNTAGNSANYLNIVLTAAGGMAGQMGYFTAAGVRSSFDTTDSKFTIYKQ